MDWKHIIDDMLARGESYASIGKAVGRTGAGIAAISANEHLDPAWSVGQKLLAMHKKLMRKYPKINDSA